MNLKSLVAGLACLVGAGAASAAGDASGLPDGYLPLDYIESAGKHVIDTGYYPNPKTKLEISTLMTGNWSAFGTGGTIYGCSSGTESSFSCNFGSEDNQKNELFVWYEKGYNSGKGQAVCSISATDAIRTARNTISIDCPNKTYKWGTASKTSTTKKTTTQNVTLHLMGTCGSTGALTPLTRFGMRIFSVKISEGGTLLHELVPAYEISTHTAGLYDLKTDAFHSNDYGDKTNPIYSPDPKVDVLSVTGDMGDFGTVTPAYGQNRNYAEGDVVTCTAPSTWELPSGDVGGRCLGYTVYTNDAVYVEGSFDEGDVCTFDYVHKECVGGAKLVWHWSAPTVYVAPAKVGGSDDNDGLDWEHPMASIQAAINKFTASRVIVSNGTYTITGDPITISKGVTLIGFGEKPSDVVINRTSGEKRIVALSDARAVVTNMTFTNGSLQLMGGITMSDGLVAGCIIRDIEKKNNANSAGQLGGGVYMSGGTLRGCTISNCGATCSGGVGSSGGGIYMVNGLVENCRIVNNNPEDKCYGYSTSHSGGGVYMTGGTLRGCLIAGNHHRNTGFGVSATGGTIENCTIADNNYTALNPASYPASSGNGVLITGNTVVFRNNIVWNNKNAAGLANIFNTSVTCNYCDTNPKLSSGTGNINEDPNFDTDYKLDKLSGCVDGALAQGWMNVAKDLAGNDRIIGPAPDMGCFEREAMTGVECSFAVSTDGGVDSATVTLTSDVKGDTTGLVYYWKVWDDAGTLVKDITGSADDCANLSLTLGANIYAFQLAVTNAAGQGSVTLPANATVYASKVYVNAEGSDLCPYETVATGAHSLEKAFALLADNGTAFVADGTYEIASRILLEKGRGTKIVSLNGPGNCIVKPSKSATFASKSVPMFELTAANARLAGLTLSGEGVNTFGVVKMNSTSAVVTNCVICDVTGVERGPAGAGINLTKGTVVDTTLANVTEGMSGGTAVSGVALTMTDGLVERVTITNCQAKSSNTSVASDGDIVKATSGTLRNVLVAGCTAGHSVPVYIGSGVTMENCSIVGNVNTETQTGNNYCGGLKAQAGATVVNTVLADNWSHHDNAESDLSAAASQVFDHCLIADRTAQAGEGNVFGHPKYRNRAAGDWRLRGSSAGVDQGKTLDWMEGGFDLLRASRIQGRVPDIGCYETAKHGLIIFIE